MSTRTSRLIEETLREWDDYAAMEDEELFECVAEPVERDSARKSHTHAIHPQTWVVRPGYTISSAWDSVESRRH
ncbi:MAG: hypothetical protein ACXWNZ_19275 [Vulcanimicrobiaceae bacterium]